MSRILLIEDDRGIVTSLSEFLRSEGFSVENADGQSAALDLLGRKNFDLVLLDVALRDGDGFAVCRAIKSSRQLPVIFLTASGDESSIVAGFDLGADDYIAKPFKPRELVSRIKNALRRYGGEKNLLRAGAIALDPDSGTVTKNDAELSLSALEYRILLLLLSNRGRLLSRERILEEIWDVAGDFVNDNTLTVYIKRIREKIEDDPAQPQIIKTMRGLGYRVD